MDRLNYRQNGRSDEIDIAEIWNLLRRNRLLIATFLIAGGGTAFLAASMMRPRYHAQTSIRIDEKQSNLPVLDVLKSLTAGNQVNTEMQVLQSRTLAEDVVDSLGLEVALVRPRATSRAAVISGVHVTDAGDKERRFRFQRAARDSFVVKEVGGYGYRKVIAVGQQVSIGGASLVLRPQARAYQQFDVTLTPRAKVITALQSAVSVSRPDREANIVVVSYNGTDRELVRDVLNVLATRFIQRRREIQQTEARSTVGFLVKQLDTLNRQLDESESALRKFQEGAEVVAPEAEAEAQVKRLADMQAQRGTANAERTALAKLLAELADSTQRRSGDPSPYRRLLGFPTLLTNPSAVELLRSLAAADDARTQLLLRRTLQDPDVQVLSARIREIEDQLHTVAVTYLEGLNNQLASLDETLDRYGDQLQRIPAKEIELARLQRRPKILEDISTMLETRLKEAQIAEAVEDASVRVIDDAIAPSEPFSPRTRLDIGLGVVVGLLLGVIVAFLREHTDHTVHTREDLQAITGLPILGLIPRISAASTGASDVVARVRSIGRVVARVRPGQVPQRQLSFVDEDRAWLLELMDPRNAVAEAYRNLRTNIAFATPDAAARVLVFTSPMPSEGKSTTAANLAITIGQQQVRVLLVDADMRRGVLHSAFGSPRDPGLSNLLIGGATTDQCIRRIDLGPYGGIDFLSTGLIPPNPSELLSSSRFADLLEKLRREYDMVLIDAPPLGVVTDAAVIGSHVDGVLLISRAGATHAAGLAYALDELRHVRANVLGAVLNDIDYDRDVRYYGGYGAYGYYRYGYAEGSSN